MKLFIVSGRSGAGKTIALRVLEDLGFYCVDNLPVIFLPELINISRAHHEKLAVSLDIRNIPESPETFIPYIESIRKDHTTEVVNIFLDADDNTLIMRYEETRRLHPLTKRNLSLEDSIKQESDILEPIAALADIRIDTSNKSIHELESKITTLVLGKKLKNINIIFESFGYKRGIAKDADYIFDARFLPNPHWFTELRPLTGLDQEIVEFFNKYPEVENYIQQIYTFLNTWLPFIEKSNRSYLTVAIGCTGGQHRSVYIAESLAEKFKLIGKSVTVKHLYLDSKKKK